MKTKEDSMAENIVNSDGVNESNGVDASNGVNESNGVNVSNGVNGSDGVNESNGVDESDGVNRSDGVNWSYGVNGSYGVSFAIFSPKKEREFTIFGKKVSEERFYEVWQELHSKLNGWFPKFNNAFTLYDASGKKWKRVDASKIEETTDAWDDMPKKAIDYLKSLPEWDAEVFEWVTELDINEPNLSGAEVEVTVNGKIYKAVIV